MLVLAERILELIIIEENQAVTTTELARWRLKFSRVSSQADMNIRQHYNAAAGSYLLDGAGFQQQLFFTLFQLLAQSTHSGLVLRRGLLQAGYFCLSLSKLLLLSLMMSQAMTSDDNCSDTQVYLLLLMQLSMLGLLPLLVVLELLCNLNLLLQLPLELSLSCRVGSAKPVG